MSSHTLSGSSRLILAPLTRWAFSTPSKQQYPILNALIQAGSAGPTTTTKVSTFNVDLQDADTTDEIESESKKEEVEVEDPQVCLCCYHTLDLTLLTDSRSWRVCLLTPAAGPSGQPATHVHTVKELLSQQSHLKYHIQKLKRAVTGLGSLQRHTGSIMSCLHEIDVHLENIANN